MGEDREEKRSNVDIKYDLIGFSIDKASVIIIKLIGSGFWLGIAYFLYSAIIELAGKATFANFLVHVFVDIGGKNIFFYPLIGALILVMIWAIVERKLRKMTIARLAPRIKELETQINPERISSELNRTGTTRKEDKKWLP